MDYLKEIQRRVKEIELSRWVDYYLNDALWVLLIMLLSTKMVNELCK
jgi:hypothetical protein